MIGDDAGTRAFANYWHGIAAPTGSKLVYSTGRSLESFLELAADKAGLLPRPDVLICAVGTKIYLPSGTCMRLPHVHSAYRGTLTARMCCVTFPSCDATDDGGWREDPVWTARLDEHWDERQMRDFAAGTAPSHASSRLCA